MESETCKVSAGRVLIEQPKPRTKRFKVFVPGNTLIACGQEVRCKHPVSETITDGKIYDMITIFWNKIPNWLCLETYNLTAEDLKPALEKRFPEFKSSDQVKVLLIEEN